MVFDRGYTNFRLVYLRVGARWSAAATLLGYRFQGSLANFLSLTRWAGLFSACVPPVPGVRSGSKEACARHKVVMSFARADGGGGPTDPEVRA
jgi:hypothetical protein